MKGRGNVGYSSDVQRKGREEIGRRRGVPPLPSLPPSPLPSLALSFLPSSVPALSSYQMVCSEEDNVS